MKMPTKKEARNINILYAFQLWTIREMERERKYFIAKMERIQFSF